LATKLIFDGSEAHRSPARWCPAMTSELRSFDERYERVLTLARALEKHHDEVVD